VHRSGFGALFASTSSSIVRLKSLLARRNSAIILPTLLPMSGSIPRPKTDQRDDEDEDELRARRCFRT
jgi:hypothetical protein